MAQADRTRQARPPVVRTFDDHAQARDAILALESAGVGRESISVVTRLPAEAETLEHDTGASDGLEDATQQRHGWSNFVEWLGRVESIAVPGFGAVLGTGDLWQDLSPGPAPASALAGSGRGSITGALVGVGIPVDLAAELEAAVLNGRILVVVHGSYDSATVHSVLGPA